MPGDLAERISTAPRRHYDGSAFRHQSPRHDPLSGEGARLAGGRFNPPESFPVLLLDAETLDHLDVDTELLIDDDRVLAQQLGELTHQFGSFAARPRLVSMSW